MHELACLNIYVIEASGAFCASAIPPTFNSSSSSELRSGTLVELIPDTSTSSISDPVDDEIDPGEELFLNIPPLYFIIPESQCLAWLY